MTPATSICSSSPAAVTSGASRSPVLVIAKLLGRRDVTCANFVIAGFAADARPAGSVHGEPDDSSQAPDRTCDLLDAFVAANPFVVRHYPQLPAGRRRCAGIRRASRPHPRQARDRMRRCEASARYPPKRSAASRTAGTLAAACAVVALARTGLPWARLPQASHAKPSSVGDGAVRIGAPRRRSGPSIVDAVRRSPRAAVTAARIRTRSHTRRRGSCLTTAAAAVEHQVRVFRASTRHSTGAARKVEEFGNGTSAGRIVRRVFEDERVADTESRSGIPIRFEPGALDVHGNPCDFCASRRHRGSNQMMELVATLRDHVPENSARQPPAVSKGV